MQSQEMTDKVLRDDTVLSTVHYRNLSHLYNRLKQDDELHHLFKSDYLKGEELCLHFAYEVKTNEDHIDLNNPITEDDYQQLKHDINDGYGNGDLITAHIGGMTDAHIGDGIIVYGR